MNFTDPLGSYFPSSMKLWVIVIMKDYYNCQQYWSSGSFNFPETTVSINGNRLYQGMFNQWYCPSNNYCNKQMFIVDANVGGYYRNTYRTNNVMLSSTIGGAEFCVHSVQGEVEY